MMSMRKRWIPTEIHKNLDPNQISDYTALFSSELGVDPLIARILALRGVSSVEEAVTFLQAPLSALPDPFLMKGMDRAVERVVEAIRQGQKIKIMGDYDCDGVGAASLCVEFFREIGASADYFIPHRANDGYGLSETAIRQAAADGYSLIISVDCGISAHAEAAVAKELGLTLLISDHHQVPEQLPVAYAIINPHQPGCSYPFKELAGVGVAFCLVAGIRKRLREEGYFSTRPEPDIRKHLDLVALSTIADVVPLHGVNRLLTKAGLRIIEAGSRPGMAAIREVADIKNITCGTIAFGFAPRLNAVGRLQDATLGADLLLESDYGKAISIAMRLDAMNKERQDIEKEILAQAIERIERGECGERTIVLADSRWNPGVIGICGSRLVEMYHRPTVLIGLAGEKGKGSGRSIRGFNLYEAFSSCASTLQGFGGHEYAAGMSLFAQDVPAFAWAFEELAQRTLSDEDMVPQVPYDAEIDLQSLSLPVVEELDILAPFGAGNARPTFVARGVKAEGVRRVGSDQKHLSFTANQNGRRVKCIAFGLGDYADGLEGQSVDLLFGVSINEWRDTRTVQCEVKDLRAA